MIPPGWELRGVVGVLLSESKGCSSFAWTSCIKRPVATVLSVGISAVTLSEEYDSNTTSCLLDESGRNLFFQRCILSECFGYIYYLPLRTQDVSISQYDSRRSPDWSYHENTLLSGWYPLVGPAYAPHMCTDLLLLQRRAGSMWLPAECWVIQLAVPRSSIYWKCQGVISPGRSSSVGSQAAGCSCVCSPMRLQGWKILFQQLCLTDSFWTICPFMVGAPWKASRGLCQQWRAKRKHPGMSRKLAETSSLELFKKRVGVTLSDMV